MKHDASYRKAQNPEGITHKARDSLVDGPFDVLDVDENTSVHVAGAGGGEVDGSSIDHPGKKSYPKPVGCSFSERGARIDPKCLRTSLEKHDQSEENKEMSGYAIDPSLGGESQILNRGPNPRQSPLRGTGSNEPSGDEVEENRIAGGRDRLDERRGQRSEEG